MEMMPWKEQARLAWRGFRWVFWPGNLQTWARIATLIFIFVIGEAVIQQQWLIMLAGFFAGTATSVLGVKKKGN